MEDNVFQSMQFDIDVILIRYVNPGLEKYWHGSNDGTAGQSVQNFGPD